MSAISSPLITSKSVVLITGANQGVGYEACKQLSSDSRTSKCIITCRSVAKAETAIASLMKDTNKPREFYDFAVLDLSKIETVNAAIESLPKIDRICLNAGVVGSGLNEESGVNENFVATLGHAKLVDGLIAAGKIGGGARVIYIGTELTRSLYGMCGMAPYICSFTEKDLDSAIHDDVSCNCMPVRSQIDNYSRAKIVGTLWASNMALKHPEIYFATTSPGAVVTNIFDGAYFPINCIASIKCGEFSCAKCMFKAAGVAHDVEYAGARYKDAMIDDYFTTKFKSGSIPQSGKCCGCIPYSGNGPLEDNTSYASYFSDAKLISATGDKVTAEVTRWENMQR
jgi:NAD(P)-dependent dehydrogenase (short-subunit alcohol dehydrogenase family)